MPYGIPADDDFWKSAGYIGGNNWFVFTPAGKLLSSDPREGLAKWKKLPEGERMPGAVKVGTAPKKEQTKGVSPPPPKDGLVIRVYMRELDKDSAGMFRPFHYPRMSQIGPWDTVRVLEEPSVDAMWLTKDEWQSLVPPSPKAGDKFKVPDAVRLRIVRAHLVDGTMSLIFPWEKEHVRQEKMTLTVERVTPDSIQLRLEGSAVLATDVEVPRTKAKAAYQPRLLGNLEYNRGKNTFTRFDIVAIGDCWGAAGEVRRIHPALGIAFELNLGQTPTDLVEPRCHQVNRVGYFQLEK